MKPGIYDALVTSGLLEAIANGQTDGQVAVLHDVDEADQPEVLARHVGDAVLRVLGSTRDEGKRVALVNDLLQRLAEHTDALPDGKPRQLHALRPPARPGITAYGEARPSTPLSDAALLTNAHGEPSLGPELRAEIDTSDEVDLICAFVKWYGLRLLEPELRRLRLRDAPFRVITTTYLGRDRSTSPRPARQRLRRRGQDPVRHTPNPSTRQGLAVPAEHRLRHGVRRILKPLASRPSRWRRVECPPLADSHAGPAEQVRRDL